MSNQVAIDSFETWQGVPQTIGGKIRGQQLKYLDLGDYVQSYEGPLLHVGARKDVMKKKCDDVEQDLENDPASKVSSRPARSSANARKGASYSSSKRSKGSQTARRKGNVTGGIHQRGDKRAVR